jgi:hypothetical protein
MKRRKFLGLMAGLGSGIVVGCSAEAETEGGVAAVYKSAT